MALQYVQSRQQKRGNSILGTLGTLATLGGTAFGVPWLSALGTFFGGANTLMNGGGSGSSGSVAQETGSALGTVLSGLKDIWTKPTDNNIAKTQEKQAADKIQSIGEKSGTAKTSSWPPYGQDYVDSNGIRWEWDKKGGCFGTGGWREYSLFNPLYDWFRG